MKRISIGLVSAALAATACGDDSSTTTGTGGSGGGTTTAATTGSTTTSTSSGAQTTGQGGAGTGGAGAGGAGTGGSGGAGGGAQVAPPFRELVDMPDAELALRALQIVGANVEGAEGHCLPCHALTEANLTNWKELTNGVLDECLTDLAVSSQESALAMIECVKARSGVPGAGKFATPALGFWAAGATRDWWRFTFEKAYPEDGAARFQEFVAQVKMPPNVAVPLDSGDYDVVGEWFVRGAPLLDEILNEEPGPGQCDDLIAPELLDYVANREIDGWRSQNVSNGMLMFGCVGDEPAIDCLSEKPEAPGSWHVDGQGALKVLATVTYESSYWTRGSADGRFIGHGAWTGNGNAAMVDLSDNRVIPVNALYDPGFFPDDSGFAFQGGPGNFCSMDVLTSSPDAISMTESGCSYVDAVGLYQHVGAGLGGGDYFAVDGPFVSDDGGHQSTLQNPDAFFGAQSSAGIVPMVYNGATFEAHGAIPLSTPYDGDAVISPSAGLLLSRSQGNNGTNSGYRLRLLDATPDGQGSFDITTSTVGRYCFSGGKPAFSFDERWIVFHHYVENTDADAIELGFTGKSDPDFAPYASAGASNIVLVDLTTGVAQRITNMPAGRYALYPFFRSDGWVYFISRTSKQNDGENVMGSAAALVAEGL